MLVRRDDSSETGRIVMAKANPIRVALSVLPAAVTVGVILVGDRLGFTVPVPFLGVFACVVFAGAAGGRIAGVVAAMIAAIFVVESYLTGFGPPTLTGSLPAALAGTLIYLSTGYLLGRISDQRDENLARLTEARAREQASNERALQQSEARFKQALDVAKIGLWVWDRGTDRCIYCSEINAQISDITPDEFLRICESRDGGLSLVHPDDRPRYIEAVNTVWQGSTVNHDYIGLKPNGEKIFVHETISPIYEEGGEIVKPLGTSVDVTALRDAEMRLRRSQRMEAIGNLTAGIAHDFNNLLTVIQGNLELIQLRTDDAESREMISQAHDASKRGAQLTRQLLIFGRKTDLNPVRIDVNAVIHEMLDLFRRTLPATIGLKTTLSDGLPQIEIDRVQFESALLNLVINARDAMPDGGSLTIQTSPSRTSGHDQAESGSNEASEAGDLVLVAVGDTGVGMSFEVQQRACEPFFTTKKMGQGTGLGLATVYGFTVQSGGHLEIRSDPGAGTTIKLFFPAAVRAEELASSRETNVLNGASSSANILVVEDIDEVRKVLVTQLEQLGYSVSQESGGADALRLLKSGADFDLLLTDITMPGEIQGMALAEIAMNELPDLRIIMISGNPNNGEHDSGILAREVPRLTKPVSMSDLAAVVRAELDKRESASRKRGIPEMQAEKIV